MRADIASMRSSIGENRCQTAANVDADMAVDVVYHGGRAVGQLSQWWCLLYGLLRQGS